MGILNYDLKIFAHWTYVFFLETSGKFGMTFLWGSFQLVLFPTETNCNSHGCALEKVTFLFLVLLAGILYEFVPLKHDLIFLKCKVDHFTPFLIKLQGLLFAHKRNVQPQISRCEGAH